MDTTTATETTHFHLPVRSSWISSLTYWAPASQESEITGTCRNCDQWTSDRYQVCTDCRKLGLCSLGEPKDYRPAESESGGFLLIVRKDGTGTLYAGISESTASELAGIGKVDHSVGKAYHRLFRAPQVPGAPERLSQQLNAAQVAEALEAYKAATVVATI